MSLYLEEMESSRHPRDSTGRGSRKRGYGVEFSVRRKRRRRSCGEKLSGGEVESAHGGDMRGGGGVTGEGEKRKDSVWIWVEEGGTTNKKKTVSAPGCMQAR